MVKHPEPVETLGERLQRLRVEAGLTQAQVAGMANVPLASLRNWENDRREPGWRALFRLASTLDVDPRGFADTREVAPGEKVQRPAGPTKYPIPPTVGPSRLARAKRPPP